MRFLRTAPAGVTYTEADTAEMVGKRSELVTTVATLDGVEQRRGAVVVRQAVLVRDGAAMLLYVEETD